MTIRRIEIRLLDLPLREPFAAAHGTTTSRELVVVRVETDRGEGWGECSALPDPTYTTEFAAGAFVLLDEELAPRLIGFDLAPGQVLTRLSTVTGNPMAKAALEMAVLDATLRADGVSLAAHLGVEAADVPAGVAVGLAPPADVVAKVARLAEQGYGRVKVKIVPESAVTVVEQLLLRFPAMEIQVDANGSFGPGDTPILLELATSGISAIEQPFPAGQTALAAVLVSQAEIPIVADESAPSTTAVERLHRNRAASGVSIKPPRLGGVLTARAVHDQCRHLDLTATAGGMLESGLGRHALAALAGMEGFTLTGDISPAGRWLAADPWPDLVLADGRVEVPRGPGVAGDPDLELLEQHTSKHSIVGAQRSA